MLPSLEEYERFIYSLSDQYPIIRVAQIVVIRTSATTARVQGQLQFDKGIVLHVRGWVNFRHHRIQTYSYGVYRGEEPLYWYDPQPHPDDPSLASTFPHHKHVPPNIKRNRIPAPGLSFEQPNLPFLIEEIERELLSE